MRVVSAERIEVIRKAVGISVVENQDKLAAIVDAIEGVREQTAKAFKAGVQIGRELSAMLSRLTEDEGYRALRASADLFPGWSYGNLIKMIAAARLFDSGWVDHAILPVHYSVLYELSHLDEAGIRKAAERQLITPTLTRIEADKVRRLVADQVATDAPESSVSDRPQEVTDIDAQIKELRTELRNLVAKRTRAMARFRKERRKTSNAAP
jgi:hypothetical protein